MWFLHQRHFSTAGVHTASLSYKDFWAPITVDLLWSNLLLWFNILQVSEVGNTFTHGIMKFIVKITNCSVFRCLVKSLEEVRTCDTKSPNSTSNSKCRSKSTVKVNTWINGNKFNKGVCRSRSSGLVEDLSELVTRPAGHTWAAFTAETAVFSSVCTPLHGFIWHLWETRGRSVNSNINVVIHLLFPTWVQFSIQWVCCSLYLLTPGERWSTWQNDLKISSNDFITQRLGQLSSHESRGMWAWQPPQLLSAPLSSPDWAGI